MKTWQNLKTHPYRYAIIFLLLVGGGFWWYKSKTVIAAPTRYALTQVQKGTLIVSVAGTGQVSAVNSIDLKPSASGAITKVNYSTTQAVKAGDVIAIVDQKDALAGVQKAKAALESAQANYQKVKDGTASTDVQTAQNQVDSAAKSLANAKNNLDLVTTQQTTAVANAFRNYLNGNLAIEQVPSTYQSQTITASDAPTLSGAYSGTAQGTYTISQQGPYFSVSGLETQASTRIDSTNYSYPLGKNGLYVKFPNTGISAAWQVQIPNLKSGSYLSTYNSYQTALQNQTSALTSAQNQIDSAQTALDNAKLNLQQKQTPATAADLAVAKSQITSAQVDVQNAENTLSGTVITAPFDGQLATLSVQKGDEVTPSTVVATLITKQQVASVTLNEVDVAKVKVGQPVTLTFDAIPNLTISGKVSQVDAIGTVSQGVVNYTVKIAFDTQDDRVKSGMSASAGIITDTEVGAMLVPNSAVKTQNGNSYVQLVSKDNIDTTDSSGNVTLKNSPAQTPVQVTIANDTMTAITGLQEGDSVVSQTISSAAAKAASATSNNNLLRGLTGGGGGGTFIRSGAGGGGFRGN